MSNFIYAVGGEYEGLYIDGRLHYQCRGAIFLTPFLTLVKKYGLTSFETRFLNPKWIGCRYKLPSYARNVVWYDEVIDVIYLPGPGG
jgi:hypothetical protein